MSQYNKNLFNPIRIQRKRIKGWRMPENTVYVGRPSKWGNPFKAKTKMDNWIAVEKFRDYLLGQYKDYNKHLKRMIFLKSIVKELKGKNLACWCKEKEPCHADILLKIANEN